MEQFDLIVIGGGPAGIMAAGKASEEGLKVLIVEKKERLGRKLLITGKGRCNITNTANLSEFLTHVFPNAKFLRPAFSQFFNKDIVALLSQHGLETVEERGARVFPKTDKSADVLKALTLWLQKFPVKIELNTKVKKILIEDNKVAGVEIEQFGKTSMVFAKSVILATGGKSYPATGSTGDGYWLAKELGHTIVDPKPALVPLETKGDKAQNLQGLNLRNVNAVLWIDGKKIMEAFGEMIFTHFGLSGPIILTLSREAVRALDKNQEVKITIDLKPALDDQKLDLRLIRELDQSGKKQIDNILKTLLPAKMIPVFMKELGYATDLLGHQITSNDRKKLRLMLKNFDFEILRHRSFKEAIITSGGIELSEINPKTMESKLVENLYFAGEVLDLDAETGGYNLQIAYSTGWLAGWARSKKAKEEAEA